MKKLLLNTLLIVCAATVQANADAMPACAARPTVPQFQTGDRWCVLGDSITHAGSYHQQIELFHLTRHPAQPLEVINCGVGGDSAPGVPGCWKIAR